MKIRLIVLLLFFFSSHVIWAASQDEITRLEADMLKHLISKDRRLFYIATDELKKDCKEDGNETLFYKAWSNQAIFEATLQNYQKAFDIAHEIMDYAQENNSIYGEYSALHAEAMILLQKQDYDAAEKAFLDAVEYHHKHFPNASAGEDLQELMKIANHRKDSKAGERYARQIINEPNVAPIHKGRALYRLSQQAFNKNDTVEFNHIYDEMMKLKKSDGIGTIRPIVEVNYNIMNGNFQEALELSDQLNEEERAERKAVIYHRMGDDANAYKYMMLYKRISDSITLVSHGNVVATCYVQMNNERLQLEQQLLEKQNNQLRNRFYMVIILLVLIVLLLLLWKGRKLINELRSTNFQLILKRKDAERALDDLNELSYYESKTELPLTTLISPNEVCNRQTSSLKPHCHKGVTTVFMTDFSDDFKIMTNPEALKKLLKHLLEYSARYTHKGSIKLSCTDSGQNVRFTITDNSEGLGGHRKNQLVGMFLAQDHEIRYVGMNFNICQSITRLLHGRIWHDMEYTNGTRFCFEIPKDPSVN